MVFGRVFGFVMKNFHFESRISARVTKNRLSRIPLADFVFAVRNVAVFSFAMYSIEKLKLTAVLLIYATSDSVL